jgi:hypothetical protein
MTKERKQEQNCFFRGRLQNCELQTRFDLGLVSNECVEFSNTIFACDIEGSLQNRQTRVKLAGNKV